MGGCTSSSSDGGATGKWEIDAAVGGGPPPAKVLILGGAPGSGRSTFFKHGKMLYPPANAQPYTSEQMDHVRFVMPTIGSFTDIEYRRSFLPVIEDNLLSAAKELTSQLAGATDSGATTPIADVRSDAGVIASAVGGMTRLNDSRAAVPLPKPDHPKKPPPFIDPQYKSFALDAKTYGDPDGVLRGLNRATTVCGVRVPPPSVDHKRSPSTYTTGMVDSDSDLCTLMMRADAWNSWRFSPNSAMQQFLPEFPQPDVTKCCDNETLRLILRVVFTGRPSPAAVGDATDNIVLPFFVPELIVMIADYTTGSLGAVMHRFVRVSLIASD